MIILTLADIRVHTGWNTPRKSMLLVHPDGLGSTVDHRNLNISFERAPTTLGMPKPQVVGIYMPVE